MMSENWRGRRALRVTRRSTKKARSFTEGFERLRRLERCERFERLERVLLSVVEGLITLGRWRTLGNSGKIMRRELTA